MNIDIGQAITYVFKDPEWIKKIAIGGLLCLLPVIGWLIVAGYLARIIVAAYAARDTRLPEWDDFGGDLVRGLQLTAAVLVWAVPMLLLILGLTLILVLVSAIDEQLGTLFGLGLVGFYFLMILFSIVLGFVMPLVIGRVAVTGSISAGLDVSAILAEVRAHPVPVLVVFLIGMGIQSVAQFGLILCFVGVIFTIFWSYTVSGHLYGQLRQIADGRINSPQHPVA